MNKNIKLFKLVTGEEIIAKVIKSNATEHILEDAVSLVYQSTNDGRMTAGFAPYMPYAEGSIFLNPTTVISSTDQIKDKVIEQYHRVFSDIILAPAGAI